MLNSLDFKWSWNGDVPCKNSSLLTCFEPINFFNQKPERVGPRSSTSKYVVEKPCEKFNSLSIDFFDNKAVE